MSNVQEIKNKTKRMLLSEQIRDGIKELRELKDKWINLEDTIENRENNLENVFTKCFKGIKELREKDEEKRVETELEVRMNSVNRHIMVQNSTIEQIEQIEDDLIKMAQRRIDYWKEVKKNLKERNY